VKGTVVNWLEDTVLPWPEADGPWEVALHWAEGESGVVCTGFDLRLQQGSAPESLTASRLRSLRLQELVKEGRRQKYYEVGGSMVEAYDDPQGWAPGDFDGVGPGFIEGVRDRAADWVEPPRGRRLDDDHFRRVAVVYSTALDAGANPLGAVMNDSEWSPTTKPTASRWVARARELGYLPPTGQGKATGNPDLVPSRRTTP
jgi:hypothetical protein